MLALLLVADAEFALSHPFDSSAKTKRCDRVPMGSGIEECDAVTRVDAAHWL